MSDRVLRPNPARTFVMVMGFAALASLEFAGSTTPDWNSWLGFALWTVIALVLATQLFPGTAYLKLSDAGFEVRSPFRTWSCRWDDVSEFRVERPFVFRAIVTFSLLPSFQGELLPPVRSRWMRDRAVVPDTYGMSAVSLARLLNDYKGRSERLG